MKEIIKRRCGIEDWSYPDEYYYQPNSEIIQIDDLAGICGYFEMKNIELNNGYCCHNPFNESWCDNLNIAECSPFDCPLAYLACKKDFMILDPKEYHNNKERIDSSPDQPDLESMVFSPENIKSDMIRHYLRNYPWRHNHEMQ